MQHIVELEHLSQRRSGRILRMNCLIAAGMLPRTHVALARHFFATGHLGLGHLAQTGGAGDSRQQRPGKQDSNGKPAS